MKDGLILFDAASLSFNKLSTNLINPWKILSLNAEYTGC